MTKTHFKISYKNINLVLKKHLVAKQTTVILSWLWPALIDVFIVLLEWSVD